MAVRAHIANVERNVSADASSVKLYVDLVVTVTNRLIYTR